MRKLLLIAVGAIMMLTVTGAGAYAASKKYTGLYVKSGDTILGEIDRTTDDNNKVHKDTKSADGDHMRIVIPFRDRQPKNGKGVHASVQWKKHARDCGLNGIEIHVTGGGISTSCDDQWKGNGDFESDNVSDSQWWFVKPRKYFNGTDNSLRGGIHVCQAQWNSDPCSGKRWVTTFWD